MPIYQDTLFAAAAFMNNTAAILEDDSEIEREFYMNIEEAEEDILLNDIPQIMRCTGKGIFAIASSLSGPGSCGPYDQIAKVHEWFPKALSWPDREFRHSFR